jgi:hypothetical protein
MQRFERDVDIVQPVPVVFDALRCRPAPGVEAGGDRDPAHEQRQRSGRRVHDRVFAGRVLGRRFESGVRYSEVVPDRVVAIDTTSGPFRLTVRATVEPDGSGTLLRTTWTGEGRGAYRLVEGHSSRWRASSSARRSSC